MTPHWVSHVEGVWSSTLPWGTSSAALGIGLGDVLLATVFPLVMRKAFGRAAGIAALVIALLAIGTMLALPLKVVFPAMVVLGPLMMLQYLYWRSRRGPERTTRRYLLEDRWHRRGKELPAPERDAYAAWDAKADACKAPQTTENMVSMKNSSDYPASYDG